MSPIQWVREHPGLTLVIVVMIVSLGVARLAPIEKASMLGNENVLQILGVILAGLLAVLALTVPSLLEVRAAVHDSAFARELEPQVDAIMGELRSNTLGTFALFGLTFFISILLESTAGVAAFALPLGFTAGTVFCAFKITAVTCACLAMWDSVEPLFSLGQAMTMLKAAKDGNEPPC